MSRLTEAQQDFVTVIFIICVFILVYELKEVIK